MAMADASTIFALSSGPGKAGVAVIRVSGPAAREALVRMASPEVLDRRAGLRRIVHPVTGDVLDHALVLFFAGPRSETGEDVAEFQVHGGRAVVRAVLEALGNIPGCRLAEPGEFARRAFDNGKLDLVEIEALADLVDAETEAQRRLALRSGGVLSTLYEGWRSKLIEIAALVEAAIDFSDEGDVGAKAFAAGRERATPLLKEIRAHLDDGHRGEILREGFRVALLGAPNAGKSSLLNALARRDAAIVSEEAGTTRDVIEVRLDLSGLPVIVSDTAGIREAKGEVEREGIRRSMSAARNAELVLWLYEPGGDATPPSTISRETLLLVETKADLMPHPTSPTAHATPLPSTGRGRGWGEQPGGPPEATRSCRSPTPTLSARGEGEVFSSPLGEKMPARRGGANEGGRMRGQLSSLDDQNDRSPTPTLSPGGEGAQSSISTQTGAGIEALIRLIATRAGEAVGTNGDQLVITQVRHRQHLEGASRSMERFLAGDPDAVELRAEDVRQAAHALGRITGRVDVEDVLDQIFSRFCIGK